jgi:RNA polymerase sigma-70 factor (ECF subfamily)
MSPLPASPEPAVLSAPPCSTSEADPAQWFKQEVHPHGPQLKSYLRGNFPAVRDVDDVVQESYLRIWKARTMQPILSAKAFLFKVARHVALDLLRRNKSSPVDFASDFSSQHVLEDRPSADEAAILQERIDLLGAALAALPARRREVIVLRKLKRLSQAETAAQLGLTERAVGNLHARALRQLEDYLRARGFTTSRGEEK